ncbi:MAG: pirin family protein [Christensenellales bacterium]|jgi:redox-sensitive bicupin YhaK (pirin superfamily)
MDTIRKAIKTVTGSRQTDGAGVNLTRVLSRGTVKDFDPFLMLDAFDSTNPDDYTRGFPWHPHRGIETVTYLISGRIEHGDSLGNSGEILDGCCQWMTAGGGIIHQEMPTASPRMLGVQLWLNLPSGDKMTSPHYRDIQADMVPEIKEDGAVVRVISGDYKGEAGAIESDYVKMTFLDIALNAAAEWTLDTTPGNTLFVYIIEGDAYFEAEGGRQNFDSRSAVLFSDGSSFFAKAGDSGARLLLFTAPPLREPVAWGGPIVMNTQEELSQAFRDIDEGNFISHDIKGLG